MYVDEELIDSILVAIGGLREARKHREEETMIVEYSLGGGYYLSSNGHYTLSLYKQDDTISKYLCEVNTMWFSGYERYTATILASAIKMHEKLITSAN